ncbi:MAG: hypothetical protein D6736_00550 [Nitrospinota bacterium]|nr:MAG: hypothetical protein D6736_00550 [Nitrospinota bacterium]
MLDAVNLERRGIPAAVVGLDKLVQTTGRGMARAQGYPGMRFAVIPYATSDWGGAAQEEELRAKAQAAAPQVERILTAES